MQVSQKTQYALRAVYELAMHYHTSAIRPVKVSEIAKAQAIPPRFLEVILNQLKKIGLVESRRGNEGGYRLARSPESITVGEVIEFTEGPVGPINCLTGQSGDGVCPLHGDCVFMAMWEDVRNAIEEVYSNTTFEGLLQRKREMHESRVNSYVI